MTQESASELFSATCKCCKQEFTFAKNPKGGRPQTHCSRECAKRYSDRERSYRWVAAHTKLQKQFINAKTYPKRQALLARWFQLYAMNLAGIEGGLSDNQRQGLTSSFLFAQNPPVPDPYATHGRTTHENVYRTFISYVKAKGISDPYSVEEVTQAAGLAREVAPEVKSAKAKTAKAAVKSEPKTKALNVPTLDDVADQLLTLVAQNDHQAGNLLDALEAKGFDRPATVKFIYAELEAGRIAEDQRYKKFKAPDNETYLLLNNVSDELSKRQLAAIQAFYRTKPIEGAILRVIENDPNIDFYMTITTRLPDYNFDQVANALNKMQNSNIITKQNGFYAVA